MLVSFIPVQELGRSEVKEGLVAEEDSQLCGLVDTLLVRTKAKS